MMDEPIVKGHFRVIRMDDLFHVVFRPDDDPEWFRIVGSFYTYERAWSYCDIEEVLAWEPDTSTGDEEAGKLRLPPVGPLPSDGHHRDLAETVRNIYDSGRETQPTPEEDFSDHPAQGEPPKDWRDRTYADAIARQVKDVEPASPEAPTFPPADELTINQRSALAFFISSANEKRLISASYREIADNSQVSRSGVLAVVEALERKGCIEIIERGSSTSSGVFRLRDPGDGPVETNGPKCRTCGKPRHPSSAAQCRDCFVSGGKSTANEKAPAIL
jgi:hypothetical protein